MQNEQKSINHIKNKLNTFVQERDWDQFHSPKNLSMALAIEVAEIMEHFQWLTEAQSQVIDDTRLQEIKDEIGDVLIYLIRLSDKLNIDLLQAAYDKLEKNNKKYPTDMVRGKALKYNEYKK
jgi:NTP pyrophosphatase (non-canonical NTP hydrolase)